MHHVFYRDGHRFRRRANLVQGQVTFIELMIGDLVLNDFIY